MAAKANKLQSQKIAQRIEQLQAEQKEAEAREDKEADALLLRLARKSHLRESFIEQATRAVKQHEREVARERASGDGEQNQGGE